MSAAVLTDEQVEGFVSDGFVRLAEAFPRGVATAGRELLWRETGIDPDDPATWTQPVVRLGGYSDEPFRQAVNTPRLHAAFDQLAGHGRWEPRQSLGTFPIRFPHPDDPGDAGWHVDGSFLPGAAVTLSARDRILLMLFLFSDVGPDDAPTRIRVGSHLDVPPLLEPAGEDGVPFFELAGRLEKQEVTTGRRVALATGSAGDVYLCHPFLVHSAQEHHGSVPRFMAQPPLPPAEPLRVNRADGDYSPVELAARRGLGR